MDTHTFRGRCLCGTVSVTIECNHPKMSACHCSICRHWAGGPFMSVEMHQPVKFDGDEHIRTYPSSEWAERGFCAQCGTHLFYRLKQGSFYAVSVGLFEQSQQWPFALQVFVDEKPGNYSFANITREMTGEEVFKAFSADNP